MTVTHLPSSSPPLLTAGAQEMSTVTIPMSSGQPRGRGSGENKGRTASKGRKKTNYGQLGREHCSPYVCLNITVLCLQRTRLWGILGRQWWGDQWPLHGNLCLSLTATQRHLCQPLLGKVKGGSLFYSNTCTPSFFSCVHETHTSFSWQSCNTQEVRDKEGSSQTFPETQTHHLSDSKSGTHCYHCCSQR